MSQCKHQMTFNKIIYYCINEEHDSKEHHSYYFDEDIADYIESLRAKVKELEKLVERSMKLNEEWQFVRVVKQWMNDAKRALDSPIK